MKIDSVFHVLVFLMAVLVLGMPFTILAQQNSEWAEAIVAAEQDAKADVNQSVWGAVGFLCSVGAVYAAYFHRPPPPAVRFVGKSPEYIRIYTQTYKAKVRNRQAGPATLGCLAGLSALYLVGRVSSGQ